MIELNVIILLLGLVCFLESITGIPYDVSVYTGDVFGAGTDAKVYLTLYGENGKTKEQELDTKNRNDFERNHVDNYKLDVDDVGRLDKITIRHDDSWLGSGWFLDKVVIKDKNGCTYDFPCHKWLASNWGDKKVSRDLITKTKCDKGTKKNIVCNRGLGMNSGVIKDSQITASSSYDDKHQPFHARLKKIVKGSRGAWCSAFADDTEYLQINFNDTTQVAGVATQGQAMFDNWVTKYSLSYSNNGTTWKTLQENDKVKEFKGNTDRDSVITHGFKPINAKAIRVHPLAWEGLTNCMRVELYGCVTDDSSNKVQKRVKEKHQKKKKIILSTPESNPRRTILDKAVLYLQFEKMTDKNTILDQSDLHNDARIVNFARLSRFSEKCGRGVDLNGGDILLNGEHFVNKPRYAVTIATWVKFYSNEGLNSVFDTIGGENSTHSMGQYHLEVINGSVRWFHRDQKGKIIFHVLTEVIVPAHIWTHIACTYDATSGYAQVFVNAKFVMREEGSGLLSQDWQVKAGIGEHKGERLLDGLIDEFYISNEALSQEEIKKLMKRCEFEKECFAPIGMEDLKIKDDQITASSVLEPHKPYYARLNLISFFDDDKRSAWCSDDDDKEPYLTIDMKTEKTISGVAVQGASVFDSFVTSYKLCYSHSGRKYDCVKENGTGETLMGSEDKDNIRIHWLNRFFDARFVRFYPLSWYGENICMRVELYGCITGLLSDTIEERLDKEIDPSKPKTPECSASCGKGTVKTMHRCNDEQPHPKCQPGKKTYEERTECIQPSCPDCFASMGTSYGSPEEPLVSSTSDYHFHAENGDHVTASNRGEIVPGGSWCAKKTDAKQYLEIDLNKPIKVTGLGTQGRVIDDHWVSKYRVSYSVNGLAWNNYTEDYRLKLFTGNEDKDTLSIRHLKHPVTARYVRVHPLTWHGGLICMRAEIFGCDHSSNIINRSLLNVKNNPKIKKGDIRQLPVVKAKPTHQISAFKEDAAAHLKDVVYTDGGYRHLAGSTHDSKVIPVSTITTSKKTNTHAQNHVQAQNPMARKMNVGETVKKDGTPNFLLAPPFLVTPVSPMTSRKSGTHAHNQVENKNPIPSGPKNILAGKMVGLTSTKIGPQRYLLPLHALRHPSNFMQRSIFQVAKHGQSQFYFNPHQKGYYISNNAYINQGLPIPHYSKVQAFNSLINYPSRLVSNGLEPQEMVIPPSRAFKTDSRRINNQRFISGTFDGKQTLTSRPKKPKPGLSHSYTQSLYNGKANVVNSNINTFGTSRLQPGTGKRISYLLSQSRGFLKPRLEVLNNAQRLSSLPMVRKPNLFIPQTSGASRSNLISLNLKDKFKDSVLHHFLEERLSKPVAKEQKAVKNNKVEYLDYNWSAFGPCSVSCGRGVKERYRRCNPMECLADGSEIQILPCFNPPCKGSTEWSSYSRCSVSCGTGIRTRTRSCDGIECPRTGKEIATISCKNPDCPVLNLDFETIDGHVIIDQSGKGNNAFLDEDTRVTPYRSLCGHHADLGSHGNLLLEDVTFRKKPKYGISIACWINLQGTSQGSHSIFSTSKMVNVGQIIGGYHFEVDDGKVRWFHRSPSHNPVFSVVTEDLIHPNTWYHLVGTYSSNTKKAKVYIDGKPEASSPGSGLLDDDWGYRASIGSFDFDGRFIQAKLDDFFMYDYEISPEQIQGLLSIKCPIKKHKKTRLTADR